jgi:hypothetical protein
MPAMKVSPAPTVSMASFGVAVVVGEKEGEKWEAGVGCQPPTDSAFAMLPFDLRTAEAPVDPHVQISVALGEVSGI